MSGENAYGLAAYSLHRRLCQVSHKGYSLNDLPKIQLLERICTHYRLFGVLWRQVFRISPINLRCFLKRSPYKVDSMTQILFALAYLSLFEKYRTREYREYAEFFLLQIAELRSMSAKNFAVRQGKKLFLKLYHAQEDDVSPLLSAWAGNAFLYGYNVFKKEKYLTNAKGIFKYFLEEHPKDSINNTLYFYYDPSMARPIYNASAEISAFLCRYGDCIGESRAKLLGHKGLRYIREKQNADGSWYYGDGSSGKYIDNYHTAFILYSMISSNKLIGDKSLQECFNRGINYYRSVLIKDVNVNMLKPAHYSLSHIPTNSSILQRVDIQDCAMAMILYSYLPTNRKSNMTTASRIWNWTSRNMKNDDFFCREITWFWKNRIPYIEPQAWMLLALAKCALHEE